MLLKINLLLIAFIGAFNFLQAQPNSTGKIKPIKPYELKAVSDDNIELTISKTGDNINVTAKGVREQGRKGCNNCNVSNKIIFTGGAEEAFAPKGSANKTTGAGTQTTAVGVQGVKIVLAKNPGGQPVKTTSLNADGSFSFTGVPKGTYQLKLGDNVIATGYKIGGE